MNDIGGTSPWWAGAMIVALPLIIIALAELDERLRQAESPLRRSVTIVRTWSLPAFATWAILVPVLGVDARTVVPIVVSTVLVLSLSVAAFAVLRVVIEGFSDRRRRAGDPVPQLLLALPRIMLLLLAGWLLIGGVWGVDLSAALAALGVTSLVISFALQDTLSGLASGMLLLSDRPFQPGDWINSGDLEGKVLDINWRTTRIRNRQGDIVVVPNSQLAGASILNYAAASGLHRVDVDLQVAFSNPPTLAKAMLIDAALNTPNVLAEPEPVAVVTVVDDPLMGYQVQMWVEDYADAPRAAADFGALVWYHSHRHGVVLPSPAQDLYVYDGVAAGQAAVPTIAEKRAVLSSSQLLASLEEPDLDALAGASRLERFSADEIIVDTRSATNDLVIIVDGRAGMSLVEADGVETLVTELGVGESVGLLGEAPGDDARLISRAIVDCEVIVVDAQAAAAVGSRNIDVAAAFNRVVTLRRRRVERLHERRRSERAAPATDDVRADVRADDVEIDEPAEVDDVR